MKKPVKIVEKITIETIKKTIEKTTTYRNNKNGKKAKHQRDKAKKRVKKKKSKKKKSKKKKSKKKKSKNKKKKSS